MKKTFPTLQKKLEKNYNNPNGSGDEGVKGQGIIFSVAFSERGTGGDLAEGEVKIL